MRVLACILLTCTLSIAADKTFHHDVSVCARRITDLNFIPISQDILYNTALKTCLPDSLSQWNYKTSVEPASAEFVDDFDVPAGARLACARVELTCAMAAKGMLASFLPHIDARVHNDVCVRGAHIFSRWRISDNPLIQNFGITQDLQLGRDGANVTVGVRGAAPFPMSILTPTIYAHADDMTRIASVNFVSAICDAS
jgi:hypothetical protein